MRRALVLAIGVALAAAAPATAAAPPAAQVWVTTPDGAMKMSDRGSVRFRTGGSGALTISVDPSRRYQTMEGFGASITDSSAHVLSRLNRRTRTAAMRSLFRTNRLSFLRQPMGASDFVAGDHYTYDDLPPGQTDYGMRRFSIAHDRAEILPLLRQALALNPQIKVIGSPWSPPAWMKTNQSLIGGRLIDEPRIYEAYARYFVKFVQAYERAGVPIYALTMQNEPQNRNPSGYPGMDMPVAQQAKLIEALGPALRRARLDTKILGYDHNWSVHPNDLLTTPPREDPEEEYPTKLLDSAAARWIAGTAFHCYSGDPSRQTVLQHAFPDKGVWFTECSGSHGPTDPPAQVFSDTLKWHTRNLVLGVTRNWGKTVVNWNIALDPAGDPHNGGCDTCLRGGGS
jgi:glucosylceramidase